MNGLAYQSTFHAISWIQQDTVAGGPAFDSWADLNNISRAIESENRRQGNLDPGHSPAREDVVVVERCGSDSYESIALAKDRVGKVIFQDELRRAALFPQHHRSHGVSVVTFSLDRPPASFSSASCMSAFVS